MTSVMTSVMTVRMMTKGTLDRKVLQRVRSETEQNERLLGRVIVTALSTCGTLMGWMVLSQAAHGTATPSTDAGMEFDVVTANDAASDTHLEAMPNPTIAPVQIDFAPIPTLPTMPDLMPVPTLMPYVAQPISADVAPAQNNNVTDIQAVAPATNDVSVSAPAPANDMPALRVVVQPTAPVIKVVPQPAAPQPANPRPNPGGNSGGSK